jgi:hypothetical protein
MNTMALLDTFKTFPKNNRLYLIYLIGVVAPVILILRTETILSSDEIVLIFFPIISTVIRSVSIATSLPLNNIKFDFIKKVIMGTLLSECAILFLVGIIPVLFDLFSEQNEWSGLLTAIFILIFFGTFIYTFSAAFVIGRVVYWIRSKERKAKF